MGVAAWALPRERCLVSPLHWGVRIVLVFGFSYCKVNHQTEVLCLGKHSSGGGPINRSEGRGPNGICYPCVMGWGLAGTENSSAAVAAAPGGEEVKIAKSTNLKKHGNVENTHLPTITNSERGGIGKCSQKQVLRTGFP